MAYQQDFLEKDKNSQTDVPGEQVISNPSSTISAAPGQATGGQETSSVAQKKGSGFTNLSTYVNANKDQSQQLAKGLINPVQESLQGAQQQGQEFSQRVGQEANKAAVQDQGVVKALQESPQKLAEQSWKDLFAAQTKGYAGPSDVSGVSGYQDVVSSYNKAQQQAESLKNNANIQSQLQDKAQSTGHRYGMGSGLLDTFLATSGEGAKELSNFRNQYANSGFNAALSNLQSSGNQQLQSAKTTTEATKKATEDAYSKSLGDVASYLASQQSAVNKENQGASTQLSDLQDKLRQEDVGALQSVGLSKSAADLLKQGGVDLGSLVSLSNSGRKLGDLVSSDKAAAYNALLGLKGKSSEYDLSKSGNAAATLQQSGKITQGNEISDLLQSLQGRLASNQAARDKEYADAQQAINVSNSANQEALSDAQISTYAKSLGLSPEDYKLALANRRLTPGMVSKGTGLNLGDIASESERSKYGQLLQSLGLSSAPNLADTQNEGSSYSVNLGDLLDQLAGIRSAAAQRQQDKVLETTPPIKPLDKGDLQNQASTDVVNTVKQSVNTPSMPNLTEQVQQYIANLLKKPSPNIGGPVSLTPVANKISGAVNSLKKKLRL